MSVSFNKAPSIFIRREGLILHARGFQDPDPEPFEDAFNLPGHRFLTTVDPDPPDPGVAGAEVEPDDFSDETHLIVDGNDDPAILLISPSPPRPLGRVLATSVPPRLLSAN